MTEVLPESIIIVHDSTDMGGAELNLLNIMQAFRSWGIRIYFITQRCGTLWPDFCKSTEDQLVVDFPYPTKIKSWVHRWSFKHKVRAFLKGILGRKVFLVGDLYPLWATLLARQPEIPVYSIWQSEYRFEDDSCVRKWILYGANRADRLIASEIVSAHANQLNLLRKEVFTLNPYLHIEKFDPLSSNGKVKSTTLLDRNRFLNRQEERVRLGWKDRDRIAICVGRVGQGKGQLWLAESFLNRDMGDWKLVIVGPAEASEATKLDTYSKLSNGSLFYLGERRDVACLLLCSDLKILPGILSESFGLVAAEAVLAGLPILATRVGSLPAILGTEYPGFFPKENREKLFDLWRNLDLNALGPAWYPRDRLVQKIAPEVWIQHLKHCIAIDSSMRI